MQTVSIPAERKGIRALIDIRKGPLNYFTELMIKGGSHAWFEILGKKVLLLNDATGIRHVFQESIDTYNKSEFYSALRPLMGHGILLTEKDIWRKQRRESAPAFSNGNFPAMTDQIVSAAESMFERWDKKIARREPIDINIEFMWFALDALLRALYHEDRENIAKNTRESLGTMLSEAEGRIWALFSMPQKLALKRAKYRNALGFLHGLVDNLVDARRNNQAYPEDLLSRLISSYGPGVLDQKMLQDQVLSFLLAGHETSANGLSWTWYEISKRPDIQEKMYQEAMQVMGSNQLDYGHVKDLDYTKQVFFEAMRLYPPVWTMSRKAMKDDMIPLDDGQEVYVPKNATIMLCANAVHRRELYWEQPEAFIPERFSYEAAENRPKLAWFPFGSGPRLCLGLKFAEIESVALMAMIAQRYKVALMPGQTIKAEPIITLRPNRPIYFNVEKRDVVVNRGHKPAEVFTPAPVQCPFSSAA